MVIPTLAAIALYSALKFCEIVLRSKVLYTSFFNNRIYVFVCFVSNSFSSLVIPTLAFNYIIGSYINK